MIHPVYLAPGHLADPQLQSDMGGSLLIGTLTSLLQNCLVVDFTDYRLDGSIRTSVANLTDAEVRKQALILFAILAKRNRIVRILEDDYSGRDDLDLVAAQVGRLHLELVIIGADASWDEERTRVPRTSLFLFPRTAFEVARAESVVGTHLNDDQLSGDECLRIFFSSFLRYSEQLDIIDGSLGQYFRDDYAYTLERLLFTVAANSLFKSTLRIRVHCRRGDGKMPKFIEDTITVLAKNSGLDGAVKVVFYGGPASIDSFKHDRCIVSEFGVINLGRGFDFVRKTNGMVRNTFIGFGGPPVDVLLAPYAGDVTR